MRYLFLEPHPDDTSLSAFFFAKELKEQGNEILVGSICNKSVKNKWRDSSKFCEKMGYTFVPTEFADQPFFAEHKIPVSDYQNEENPLEYTYSRYLDRWNNIVLDIDTLVKNTISAVNPDYIVTTLGILHLVHICTRVSIDKYFDNSKIFYYADSPYQWRAYGRPFLSKSKLTESARYRPSPEEIEEKLAIFEKCYPSEKYMITMDRYLYYRYPELIFRRK